MKTNNNSRRSFIQKTALGTLAAMGLPPLIADALAEESLKPTFSLSKNDVVLFQGDSITDAGRSRTDKAPNNTKALGTGYVFMAAADLLNGHPDKDLKIFNRGISGNKVYQLAERWDTDALELQPNVLSILIGVNDYWHFKKNNYTGTLETYRKDFNELLDRTKQKLPDLKLVIGEPFALLGSAVDSSWFPEFKGYQQVAREIAGSYNAVFIPYQRVFDNALKSAPASYWTPDGVHPSIAGARLMASAWLKATGL